MSKPKTHEVNGYAVLDRLSLQFPMAALPDGYRTDRVEVVGLTESQVIALHRLTAALRKDNERCQKRNAATPAGVVVDTPADCVRWLLDKISAQSM